MERTQSAGGIILNTRGEIAIVKNGPNFWGFPKGHIDPGEDEVKAAVREIEEETGLTEVTVIRKIGSYERYRGGLDGGDDLSELKRIHMYLFTTEQEKLQPTDPHNPEARWVTLEEAERLLTNPKDRAFLVSADLTLQK